MKIEILAKRLAQKTNTPSLAKFILGERPYGELPLDCMIWTGGKTISGYGIKSSRDSRNIPTPYRVMRRSRGRINFGGKSEYVHRLIYTILLKPEHNFTMENLCGNPLCANPRHWEVFAHALPAPPPVDYGDAEWTMEEVEESVDAMLGRYQIQSWEDVITNPLTMDIPHGLLREQLIKINKEHLT